MDWSLIIFVIVAAYFGYRGYRKGLLKSLARLLSLGAGYLAAILYSSQLAALIEANAGLKGIAAFITASLILLPEARCWLIYNSDWWKNLSATTLRYPVSLPVGEPSSDYSSAA